MFFLLSESVFPNFRKKIQFTFWKFFGIIGKMTYCALNGGAAILSGVSGGLSRRGSDRN